MKDDQGSNPGDNGRDENSGSTSGGSLSPSSEAPARQSGDWAGDTGPKLTNPIVLISGSIIGGVLILIFFAIMGWDKGHVLESMGSIPFARGLITYLFAVATVGTAVVLVVHALTEKAPSDLHFQRGKEILSLLLGIFGTIVGFYFGSDISSKTDEVLSLHQPLLSVKSSARGERFSLTTAISGGKPPYLYGVILNQDSIALEEMKENVDPRGWVVEEMTVPNSAAPGQPISITVGVRDADKHQVQQTVTLDIL